MKTIKKYSSFYDLKSAESEQVDSATRLKRHAAFKRVMMEIKAVHTRQSVHAKPTQ